MNHMKRLVKCSIIILAVLAVICFVCCQISESNNLKRNYHNNICKSITAGEKYSDGKNDIDRTEFIEALKDLVIMYAEIRDRENGDKSYDAKLLCDLLSSSYDILEVDKDQISQLDDLLDGLHMLKLDLYDKSGRANDYILHFVKANR